MVQIRDLTELLQRVQDANAEMRTKAEAELLQLEELHYEDFLYSLCAFFTQENNPTDSRRLAVIIFKNAIDAKDQIKKIEKITKWNAISLESRDALKKEILKVLHSKVLLVSRTVSMLISKMATIEFKKNEWQDLIGILLQNMSATPTNTNVKQCTLETIGYVCEELGKIDENYLRQSQVNNVLTAIVQGMTKEEESDLSVRLAATKALYNALEFAHNNFLNERERNFIMQVVCEGTICEGSVEVRKASFECLVRIAGIYYDELPPYMTDLFKLTIRAIQQDAEDVAKQAIEFWCTICENEIDILYDREANGNNELSFHNFIAQAAPSLMPVLLEQLMKQDEDQEFDDSVWTMAMSSSSCISLISNCIKNEIVHLTIPFVQANIFKKETEEDWRCREAATFAFGLILDGPSPIEMISFVSGGLEFLFDAMKDPDPRVRNTTAWTIGRIFEFIHGQEGPRSLITEANIQHVVAVLLESIQDEPHIANRVCFAITGLAAGCRHNQICSLSPFFKEIVQNLLNTAFRPVDDVYMQTRLQHSAFEAINEMVRSSRSDCQDMVSQLIPLILQKLQETFSMQNSSIEEAEKQSDLQGLLCGCLMVVIHRLADKDGQRMLVLQCADQIMETLVRIFVISSKKSAVHHEAMLAAGALTYAVNGNFSRYLHKFLPYIELGIKNHQEYQVCNSTVGTLSDVCRAVEGHIQPYADKIMSLLFDNLASGSVHRDVKPSMFSVFADIAMALGEGFEKYLENVTQVLSSAMDVATATNNDDDDDFVEYNNKLRTGILDAYSGILQGLGKVKAEKILYHQSQHMIEFIGRMVRDDSRDHNLMKAAIGLLGDIATSNPSLSQVFTNKQWIGEAIQECIHSNNIGLKDTAEWTASVIGDVSSTSETSVA